MHSGMHPELQARARALYAALGRGAGDGNGNRDAVWLVLVSANGGMIGAEKGREGEEGLSYLREVRWDIRANMEAILEEIDTDIE